MELGRGVVWIGVEDQDMLVDARSGDSIIDEDKEEIPNGASEADEALLAPKRSPNPGEATRLKSDDVMFSGRSSEKSKSGENESQLARSLNLALAKAEMSLPS